MTSIIQSIASPTAMLYWLNLAVVVTLLCAARRGGDRGAGQFNPADAGGGAFCLFPGRAQA